MGAAPRPGVLRTKVMQDFSGRNGPGKKEMPSHGPRASGERKILPFAAAARSAVSPPLSYGLHARWANFPQTRELARARRPPMMPPSPRRIADLAAPASTAAARTGSEGRPRAVAPWRPACCRRGARSRGRRRRPGRRPGHGHALGAPDRGLHRPQHGGGARLPRRRAAAPGPARPGDRRQPRCRPVLRRPAEPAGGLRRGAPAGRRIIDRKPSTGPASSTPRRMVR